MSICAKTKRAIPNALCPNLSELPIGIWVIFVGISMPLFCLAILVVRYGLFLEITRQAADVAAQAQIYTTANYKRGTGIEPPIGAVTLAQNKAIEVASGFAGLSINPDDVKCWILVTPLNNTGNSQSESSIVGPNLPLVHPPDSSKNLYQLRVDISGQIQPVISAGVSSFSALPGLNAPMSVKASITRVFENPQGLSI